MKDAVLSTATVTQMVIEADCLAYMREMLTHSVAVVVTSPPYNLGKKYGVHNDNMPEVDYLDWQGEIAAELARVLRPDGHLFLNIGTDSKHPWRAIDVALRYRPHFVLQNQPGWIKSLALDASSLKADPALHAAMHERTFGHFVPLNSEYFLNPCWEPVYHFTPRGRSLIDRTAEGVGVPYVFRISRHASATIANDIAGALPGTFRIPPRKGGWTETIIRPPFPSPCRSCAFAWQRQIKMDWYWTRLRVSAPRCWQHRS